MKLRSSGLIALLFVALMAAPAVASAGMAPEYVGSDPEHQEKLEQAPERVQVTFNQPLAEGSSIGVVDECGRTVDDGSVQIRANMMSVGIALTPIGHYYVSYHAESLGNATGSENGAFNFKVLSGDPCGPDAHGGGGNHNGGGDHSGGGQHSGGGGNHNGGSGQHSGGGNHNGGGGQHSGGGNHNGGGGQHSGGGGNHYSGHNGGSSSDHPASGSHSTGAHSTAGSDSSGSSHNSGSHVATAGRHDASARHGSGHGSRHGGAGSDHGAEAALGDDAGQRTVAADGSGIPVAPNGQAVLMALALSLGLGVVGGWFLRVSGSR